MNRRDFLKVAVAVGAVAAIPVALDAVRHIPRIYADGVNDDTEGLQAALDGKEFVCDRDVIQISPDGSYCRISHGVFVVSKTIEINRDNVVFDTCHFTGNLRAGERLFGYPHDALVVKVGCQNI